MGTRQRATLRGGDDPADRSPARTGRSRTRRVGRPPRSPEQTNDIRATIVTAAQRLFETEGYEAVSMRRIAQEVGCAAPTLYSLFQSKRDLLRNVWDQVFARLVARCQAAAVPGLPPLEGLRTFGRVYVEHWLEHPDDFRVIFLIEDQPLGPAERYFVDSSQVLSQFEAITAGFREAIASGALPRETDATMAAQAFFCVLQGLAGSLITIPEFPWADRAALVDTALAALLEGLRHMSPRAPRPAAARRPRKEAKR